MAKINSTRSGVFKQSKQPSTSHGHKPLNLETRLSSVRNTLTQRQSKEKIKPTLSDYITHYENFEQKSSRVQRKPQSAKIRS